MPSTLLPVLQVVEGYEVVKAVEACGSRGGETAADVMIADCGLLKPGGYSQHHQLLDKERVGCACQHVWLRKPAEQ